MYRRAPLCRDKAGVDRRGSASCGGAEKFQLCVTVCLRTDLNASLCLGPIMKSLFPPPKKVPVTHAVTHSRTHTRARAHVREILGRQPVCERVCVCARLTPLFLPSSAPASSSSSSHLPPASLLGANVIFVITTSLACVRLSRPSDLRSRQKCNMG